MSRWEGEGAARPVRHKRRFEALDAGRLAAERARVREIALEHRETPLREGVAAREYRSRGALPGFRSANAYLRPALHDLWMGNLDLRSALIDIRVGNLDFRTALLDISTANPVFRSALLDFRTENPVFRTASPNIRMGNLDFRIALPAIRTEEHASRAASSPAWRRSAYRRRATPDGAAASLVSAGGKERSGIARAQCHGVSLPS